MIAQQVAGKATRDALFLSSFPATSLPNVMIMAAVVSVLAVLVMSRWLSRFGPARLVPIAFVASGMLFAVEWFLEPGRPAEIAWVVYLHMAAFGSIVISGFWSVINERFDPHAAKRHVARIATGSTLGGVVGGIGAERIAVFLDVRTSLLILAALNAIAGALLFRVGASRTKRRQTVERRSGLEVLRRTPYLQQLGVLVALVAISATLVDYAFKAQAAERLTDSASLMRFFGIFYTATSILTFITQSTIGERALRKLGLDGTIALLPGAVVLFGILGAAVQRLWSAVLLRGVETVVSNSLFRSGYELLYTPVSPEKKRPTKTIIDVACERLGDAVGGGVTLVILAVAAPMAPTVVIVVAVFASATALWLTRRLNRGYVSALADSLKSGAVHLESNEVIDATTKRTLTETTMALDREKLLEQIKVLRDSQGHSDPPPDLQRDSAPDAPHAHRAATVLGGAAEDLLSGDPERIRAHLDDEPNAQLATLLIPLLARRDMNREVVMALRKLAPRIAGQLTDALLDPEQPFVVRRRLPRVLSAVHDQRAAEGLFLGLADSRFEVRYQCGQALARIVLANADVAFSQGRVFGAVLRELDVGQKVWESHRLLDDDSMVDGGPSSGWLDQVVRARLHRSVEHVFTLMSLVLDREPLELSLKALGGDDPELRGTALEYLENVLPGDVREKLWPYLGHSRTKPPKSVRPREQIVEDLLKSMDAMPIDRDALRKGSDS
jgi:hypothetical protein